MDENIKNAIFGIGIAMAVTGFIVGVILSIVLSWQLTQKILEFFMGTDSLATVIAGFITFSLLFAAGAWMIKMSGRLKWKDD